MMHTQTATRLMFLYYEWSRCTLKQPHQLIPKSPVTSSLDWKLHRGLAYLVSKKCYNLVAGIQNMLQP